MNINELPSELLVKILSYIPQRDLFTKIDHVCDYWRQMSLSPTLWRSVDYSSVYGEFTNAFHHLYTVEEYVRKLSIIPGNIIHFFGFQQKLQFLNLKELDVSDRLVVSEGLFDKIIKRCPRLESITFISDSRFNMQHCLTKLSELELVEADIGYFYGSKSLDDNLISFLQCQARLKKLALRGWQRLDNKTIVTILNDLRNLNSFLLSNDTITNEAFLCSDTPLNLTHLTLHSNQITDDCLCHIARRTKQLRFLNVDQCRSVTDKGLCAIARNCMFLESLVFGNTYPTNSHGITNRTLSTLAEHCLNLEYISTIGCQNLKDEGVIAVVQSCSRLKCIILNGCTEMTDKSLIVMSECCSFLRKADFRNCFRISAYGVYCILKSCPSINSLKLLYCTGISDWDNHIENTPVCAASKDFLTTHCHLKELELRSCTDISMETVLLFTSMCPDIRSLNLYQCLCDIDTNDLHSISFFREVFQNCRFLKKFKVNLQMVYRKDYRRDFPNIALL